MNLLNVPLPKLVPSPLNVRKTTAADLSELAASIRSHGLLQNLTVIDRGDQFEVVAGGMRLRALQQLAKDELIAPDYSVPCNVVSEDHAHETSLTENVTRHAMHPADEFDAFNKLIKDGAPVGEVAARFGKTERYVQQRLRLANVAPEILKEYRAGKATLEQMMALAITDDQKKQVRVWKMARHDWARNPDNLRETLTESEFSIGDSIGKFVGVEAYEKAGGQVRRDLFGDDSDSYLVDTDLAMRLAMEKLEKTAERVRKEGWKWVEVRVQFDWEEKNKFGRAPCGYKGIHQVYTDAAKQNAGAVVYVEGHGQAGVERGLIRQEDRKAAAKADKAGKSKSASNGKKTTGTHKPGDLSFAAIQRLQAEGGAIVATEVAKSPDIALKLLAAELVDDVFYHGWTDVPRTWTHIGREHTNRMPGMVSGAIEEECAAAKGMKTLETEWKKKLPKKRKEARAWVFEQDAATVLQLLAFLVAREIDVVEGSKGSSKGDGIVELAAAANVDLGEFWKPTPLWLGTLPKNVILALAKDAGASPIELATLAKLPKAKLPAAAAEHFEPAWLPKPLRPAKTATPKKTKPVKPVGDGGGTPFPWGAT